MLKTTLALLVGAIFFFFASIALAAEPCPDGKVCVDREDMKTFLTLAQEKKCLLTTTPEVKTDPIVVVVDKEGRVYSSGSNPRPFTVQLNWCNYNLTAQGQTKTVAAMAVESEYGFRFRPKATLGILGTELLSGVKFQDTVDGGVLLEPFFYKFLNLNAFVGVRSTGGGIGVDLTHTVGLYFGYAITWADWRSNPMAGISVALW